MTARPVSVPNPQPVAAGPRPRPRRSTLTALVLTLRPEQWTKNLLIFAGVVFSGRLRELAAVGTAVEAFVVFCALSGVVYIFNDLVDRKADQQHPLKCMRPLACGELAPVVAMSAGAVLTAAALGAAWFISPVFLLVSAVYLVLLSLYSAALKHVIIVDVLVIAAGFVLRAVAGAVALDVPISHWLLICTTLLALFLALSKRRHELTLLGTDAVGHRRSLEDYSPYLLDQMIAVVTASTLVAYTLYTTDAVTVARLGTNQLGLTIPFVLYGIFRYLYLVHQRRGGGSPANLLITDRPLLACVALWALSVVLILYFPHG